MFEGMERVEFDHEGTRLCGYAALPARTGPAPAVLVMHSALGVAHGVNEPVARKLAEQGYVAVCTDMYGAHLVGAGIEDAGLAYAENLADPDRQRARTVAWLDAVARARTSTPSASPRSGSATAVRPCSSWLAAART